MKTTLCYLKKFLRHNALKLLPVESILVGVQEKGTKWKSLMIIINSKNKKNYNKNNDIYVIYVDPENENDDSNWKLVRHNGWSLIIS